MGVPANFIAKYASAFMDYLWGHEITGRSSTPSQVSDIGLNNQSSSSSDEDLSSLSTNTSCSESNLNIDYDPPYSKKSPKQSSSCPENLNHVKSISPENYIEDLLYSIKSLECSSQKEVGFSWIFGEKEECPQFPFIEQHVHLEGIFSAAELKEMAVGASLFYDEQNSVFRRKEISKAGITRIPAHKVDILKIKSKACVQINPSNIVPFDEEAGKTTFDETFKIRGSILDRVRLSTQLLLVMKKAKEHNIIYRELMYGIYDIPVPEQFISEVDALKHNKKFLKEVEISSCIDKLKSSSLHQTLSSLEKEKLMKKIQNRFSHIEKFDEKNFFEKLLNLNYVDAKALYVTSVLDAAESEIKQTISADEYDEYDLDPNVSIFDSKNIRSVKLIDEVMRHYSLGKFIAWLLSACDRIQKSKEKQILCLREVGITVDGPQDEKARENFRSQINYLKKMRSLFPDVPFSMHALEYSVDTTPFKDELKHAIDVCKVDSEGRGRGRIGHGTRATSSCDAGLHIASLKKGQIAIEFSATTAELTTDTPVEKMPVKFFHNIGIPVTFNTDDPGIFDGTTLRSEIVRVIETFNFSYIDIKNAMRTALEYSFVLGESIYDIKEFEKSSPLFYIKDKFKNACDIEYDLKLFDQLQESSEKAKKQIQLERAFVSFEIDMASDKKKDIARTLGFWYKRPRSTSNDF